MKHFHILLIGITLFLDALTLPVCAQSNKSQKPVLIIDTEVPEAKDAAEAPKVKERDPMQAKQNINIGNYYLKQKNYAAAIERYLEAIECQPDSILAYEALARAYEKKGDITKAISTYKTYLDKNPDSPGSSEIHIRLAKLEKKPT
jgi:Tfp pilus assembly protein PilF